MGLGVVLRVKNRATPFADLCGGPGDESTTTTLNAVHDLFVRTCELNIEEVG